MFQHKSRIAIALAMVLASAAPVMAGMSGIEWMQKWKQLDKRKAGNGDPLTANSVDVGVRVVKVNIPEQQLTISHGAVMKIAMPAMSMTFPVSETTHLKMLHKGDHVTIHVVDDGGVAKVTGFKMQH